VNPYGEIESNRQELNAFGEAAKHSIFEDSITKQASIALTGLAGSGKTVVAQ